MEAGSAGWEPSEPKGLPREASECSEEGEEGKEWLAEEVGSVASGLPERRGPLPHEEQSRCSH